MGEAVLIAVIVIVGFFWVRGALSTKGGSPSEWGDWAEDEARRAGTKIRETWRDRYDDEYDEGED
jgi:hypothetical protein